MYLGEYMEQKVEPSMFLPLAELIANVQADELEIKKELPGLRKQYIERKIASILQVLEEQYADLISKMEKSDKILKEELKHSPSKAGKKHEENFALAIEKLKISKTNPSHLGNTSKSFKSDSWQDLLGLSNATLVWVYEIGYAHYEKGQFKDAETLFGTLVMLNGLISDYWVALGFAQRKMGKESEAISSFAMGTILNPENPIPRYQSAELYLKAGLFEDVLAEVETVSKIIAEKGSLDLLKADLEVLKAKAEKKESV